MLLSIRDSDVSDDRCPIYTVPFKSIMVTIDVQVASTEAFELSSRAPAVHSTCWHSKKYGKRVLVLASQVHELN
jgi:hypothetical protein